MENQILDLVFKLTSSDNNLRTQAELDFNRLSSANPNEFLYSLTQIALHTQNVESSVRQASLLHLKRLVPKFWSPAFDSFVGPILIDQNVKKFIRDSLLSQLISDSDSKIRNGASYAIVQIAAVDYPDEWPNLLNELYQSATSSTANHDMILGSLSVLHDLFDDLVTDEQFFEGGIAIQIMQACDQTLRKHDNLIEIKIETLILLKTVAQMLENVDFDENPDRKKFVNAVIPQIIELLSQILSSLINSNNSIMILSLKCELYDCLNTLCNTFLKYFKKNSDIVDFTINDLNSTKEIYLPLITTNERHLSASFHDLDQFKQYQIERKEPSDVIKKLISSQISFLQSLLEIHPIDNTEVWLQLIKLLIPLSYIPLETQIDYQADFNKFVTDETGLSVDISVRESINEFFRDLDSNGNSTVIELLSKQLSEVSSSPTDQLMNNWNEIESIAFLLNCSFSNEESLNNPSFSLVDFLNFIISFIGQTFNNLSENLELLLARFIIIVPNFLLKYEDHIKSFGVASLKQILGSFKNIPSDGYEILKSSLLISFQYFNHFIRAKEFDNEIQFQLIQLVDQLKNDSDEDSNIMLLETLSILICIDNKALSTNENFLMLTLNIGYKDCSDFSLNTSTIECIQDLITGLPLENYLNLCSKGLPNLLDILENSNAEYSPEVDLSLQLLVLFVRGPNDNFKLPNEVFRFVFPKIYKFILSCEDDQLLQSSSEVFNEFLKNSSEQIQTFKDSENGMEGNEILLKTVSKFLSPNLSDQAIAKLGDLIILLLENFQDSQLIQQYFEDILKAVTQRLFISKELITIENLILIFNKLTITQPDQTINFLTNFQIESESALIKIFPIWFQSFETMRGYEKIKSNIEAFIQIFKLNSSILKRIKVNGDELPNQVPEGVILTRSMSKNLIIQYEQIPVDFKIVKLLLNELKFQVSSAQRRVDSLIPKLSHSHDLKISTGASSHHSGHAHSHSHDADDGVVADDEDDDDDGWEDLDDIGVPTFDQLKGYVDDDDEDDDEVTVNGGRSSDDIRNILTDFFKECTARNISDFQNIYEGLNDEDKKFLTESVVFA